MYYQFVNMILREKNNNNKIKNENTYIVLEWALAKEVSPTSTHETHHRTHLLCENLEH